MDDIISTIPVSDAMFERLVPYFVERLSLHEKELNNLVQRLEVRTLATLLHQLKGSCTAFGFPSLGKIAEQMETQLLEKPDDTDGLRQLLDEFNAHCRAIHSGFDRQTWHQESISFQ